MKLIIQIPCYNETITPANTVKDLPDKINRVDQIEILVVNDANSANSRIPGTRYLIII